jgi:hypothetical protein
MFTQKLPAFIAGHGNYTSGIAKYTRFIAG